MLSQSTHPNKRMKWSSEKTLQSSPLSELVVLENILPFLSATDIHLGLLCVCREIFEIANDLDATWRLVQVCGLDWTTRTFNPLWRVKRLCLGGNSDDEELRFSRINRNSFHPFTMLKELSFHGRLRDPKGCLSLQSAFLERLEIVCPDLENVRTSFVLSLRSLSLNYSRMSQEKLLCFLKRLEPTTLEECNIESSAHFFVDDWNSDESEDEDGYEYEVSKPPTTTKEVIRALESFINLTSLSVSNIPSLFSVRPLTSLPHLRHLKISDVGMGGDLWAAETPFPSLETLEVHEGPGPTSHETRWLIRIIPTVRYFKVTSKFSWYRPNDIPFSFFAVLDLPEIRVFYQTRRSFICCNEDVLTNLNAERLSSVLEDLFWDCKNEEVGLEIPKSMGVSYPALLGRIPDFEGPAMGVRVWYEDTWTGAKKKSWTSAEIEELWRKFNPNKL